MNSLQPAAAIWFLAFSLWCEMPSDTEHTGDSAICTDGHQCCKGTFFMAAVVLKRKTEI